MRRWQQLSVLTLCGIFVALTSCATTTTAAAATYRYDRAVPNAQCASASLVYAAVGMDARASTNSSRRSGRPRLTVRDWLSGQSFAHQHEFGMDVLIRI